MKKVGTQSIETKRLLLRPFVASDYQAMYDNWASRPDNLLHVTWDAYESLEVAKQLFAGLRITKTWIFTNGRSV